MNDASLKLIAYSLFPLLYSFSVYALQPAEENNPAAAPEQQLEENVPSDEDGEDDIGPLNMDQLQLFCLEQMRVLIRQNHYGIYGVFSPRDLYRRLQNQGLYFSKYIIRVILQNVLNEGLIHRIRLVARPDINDRINYCLWVEEYSHLRDVDKQRIIFLGG